MSDPQSNGSDMPRLSLNLAIVGGGRACRFFLELLEREPLPGLNIRIVGVCDIDPQAEGLRLASAKGIYTTADFKDFFDLPELDGILELTNRRDVLVELVHLRPKGVGILEHNIGRFIRHFFLTDQRLKSAEAQLKGERMISDFLIQQARQKIMVLGTDFIIEDVNAAFLAVLNRTREEVVGQPCHRVIHGLEAPCSHAMIGYQCPMIETLRTGESGHVIREEVTANGAPAYSNIVTYPVKNSAGEVVSVIEIWRDITAALAQRWEKRVADLKSDMKLLVQEDRMISLGKLVASCVHEINNPIQGLLTFSELIKQILAQESVSPAQFQEMRQYTALMSEELERCGSIVSGLLSFSRETPRAYRDTDLNDVIKAVIALTRHKMQLQNITLETELIPRSLSVRGDKNLLQQCFLNLIFNAIEAMAAGGALTISSRIDRERNSACIRIADTGTGIAATDLDHIFDPFFTTKPFGEGTGLGLSIVYGVVKDHGGRIQVGSQPDEGTRFDLCFPLSEPAGDRPAAEADPHGP
jgi:two-component system NtrC family sensor kinase